MSGPLAVDDPATRIAEEHHEIRGLIEALEGITDLAELSSAAGHLFEVIDVHFMAEEAPGGLAQVIGSGARDAPNRLKELLGEHDLLRRAVAALRDRAGAASAHENQYAIFKTRDRVVEALRLHEGRETELLVDVLYADSGGSG